MAKREPLIVVAGKPVADPVRSLQSYLMKHKGTISHFDLGGWDGSAVTPELIKVTRSPWMGSRISREQENELIKRAATAPWSNLGATDRLVDADPLEVDGLYDQASSLWGHFLDPRHPGLAWGKVSKVLHLMRPQFFPILDTRLQRHYSGVARAKASELRGMRAELDRSRLYWPAIRDDLIASASGLGEVRAELTRTGDEWTQGAVGALSDVRLLDMLAWV